MQFCANIFNPDRVIAIKLNFKMAVAAIWILPYVNFDGKTASGTSFSVSMSNLVRLYAIAAELLSLHQKFKIAAVPHPELLFGNAGPPKNSSW